MPLPVYRFASDTTNRRFASSRCDRAFRPSLTSTFKSRFFARVKGSSESVSRYSAYSPTSMVCAKCTSSSAVKRAVFPIPFKYTRTRSAEGLSLFWPRREPRSTARSKADSSSVGSRMSSAPGSSSTRSVGSSPITTSRSSSLSNSLRAELVMAMASLYSATLLLKLTT